MIDQAMCGRIDGTPRHQLMQWIETLRAEVMRLRAEVRELGYSPRSLTEQDLEDMPHERAIRRMLELERRHAAIVLMLAAGK